MGHAKATSVFLLGLVVISLAGSRVLHGQAAISRQDNLEPLEAKFGKQFAAIEDLFLHGPAKKVFPPNPHERLRRWQDELANSFAQAATTVDEILKLHPPDEDHWRELRETLWLYSQPASPPETRTVFGSGEVQNVLAC